jgi:hypothetical protein
VVSITPRPLFIPGEKAPGTHCIGGWVGPKGLVSDVDRKLDMIKKEVLHILFKAIITIIILGRRNIHDSQSPADI